MRKSFVLIALLVIGPSLLAQQTLNNNAVLRMIRMGFSEEVIVNAINHAPGDYDTSPDGLTVLKQAGVGTQIIAAMVRIDEAGRQPNKMLTAPLQKNQIPAPSATPPQPIVANTPLPAPAVPAEAPASAHPTTVQQSRTQTAKTVYAASQNSVFLIYLNDSSGNPSALGSAFLVAPRMLVTNAHVADAGVPFLAVGPVRIPLKLLNEDEQNDLAILSIDTDLISAPLPLSNDKVAPGEEIFAIGNPEGLEKTISEGIVSGLRMENGRQLLQITSAISHGSSGGPILDTNGQVVGVAVGMIEGGQNLNFAVPVGYVQSLLTKKANIAAPNVDVSQRIDEVKDLLQKRAQEQYSSEPASSYQVVSRRLISLTNEIAATSSRRDVLTQCACWGTTSLDLSDAGISAARTLVKLYPSSESRALLAYVLYDRSQDEQAVGLFAAEGSAEKQSAKKAYDQYLTDAEDTARAAVVASDTNRSPVLSFVLGAVKDDREQLTDAITLNTAITATNVNLCGNDLTQRAYRELVLENNRASRPEEAEKWFRRFASLYRPQPSEWDAEGDRRGAANDPQRAAEAYEKAASGSKSYGYDLCYASAARNMQGAENEDAVLSDGRKCVDASVEDTDKDDQKQFTRELPVVYRIMADVLARRGVYQQGLEYVKEALSLQPDDSFGLDTEAVLFEDLERYSECISAEQSAIRASDGKYSWMHFRLGSCYFDSQDWNQAAASFRIAAQADKSDAASAFNLGLSLSRQGYSSDANQWFREALTRKPDSELRAQILSALH